MGLASTIEIKPHPQRPGSRRQLGAEVSGIDLNSLSDSDFETLHSALYHHHVLVVKNQSATTPRAQYELTKRFDPSAESYGHGQAISAKRSILHPDLRTIPHQPQVQVIGNGPVAEYEGLENITLKHPHHKTFHKFPVAPEEQDHVTRFFRWHIDAALYELHPPRVTTLFAVTVPSSGTQTLRYDDGSGDELRVSLGTTAFVSGYTMYDILSDEDKTFARTTKVQYAPHPYIWMANARSRSTGLGMYSDGLELARSALPEVDEGKIQVLPMVWKNPVTGRLALQIHPSAVEKLHLGDGTVVEDLEEVRKICYRLQRPGIAPELVYAHDWEEGDMVLFNNHGVLHSVVGAFAPEMVRVFRQCNLAASDEPLGPGDEV